MRENSVFCPLQIAQIRQITLSTLSDIAQNSNLNFLFNFSTSGKLHRLVCGVEMSNLNKTQAQLSPSARPLFNKGNFPRLNAEFGSFKSAK